MKWKVITICLISMSASFSVFADRIIMGSIAKPFYDVYRPKTREEIYASYRALVEKRDGISKLEAKLIAQYEAIMQDLDSGYDISKPKVIEETSSQWTIRFPSKFSINDHKRPADWIYVIDKSKGKIKFSGEKNND